MRRNLLNAWGGVNENVWRIEFQVRKEVLKRSSIRTFDDLFSGCGDVLRHLAHEHTTLRVRQDDSYRSRWPLHPLWAMLQEHIETLPAQGVVCEVNANERLLEQMMRLAVSVEGNSKRSVAIECVRLGGDPFGFGLCAACADILLVEDVFAHDRGSLSLLNPRAGPSRAAQGLPAPV